MVSHYALSSRMCLTDQYVTLAVFDPNGARFNLTSVYLVQKGTDNPFKEGFAGVDALSSRGIREP